MKRNYYDYWAETIYGLETGSVHAPTENEAVEKVCSIHQIPKWAVTVQFNPIATVDGL